ncbi:DUF4189 domain-containing protein [Xanthomonas axonopodis]|uniref:DUF4189 domain-containing protein n=1 Tax=Xanthomonas axonopodis TaxID=53413 RepID=UPI0035574CA6
MKISLLILLIYACILDIAHAEGGCPPGQYPIGGQGAIACAPLPQDQTQQKARPIGKWIKTWGAIASGTIDSIVTYGVSTGKFSKAEAEQEALAQCSSHGENNCAVLLTYRNQCAAVATPKIDGRPSGIARLVGRATLDQASTDALATCTKNNPNAECSIGYKNCTEPVFQQF